MKKILSLFVVGVMSLSLLAACNDTSGTTQAGTPSAPGTDTPASTGAATEGEILIGCLQDVTGPTSTLGKSVEAGAKAAVEEINANGGIDGKQVVMRTYDTKGDVTEAVNSFITAVSVDGVKLMIGPPVANIAHAIKETSEEYNVPLMGFALDPACQVKEDGTPYKNMFGFQPSAVSQGEIMAAFAIKNGYNTYGVLYNQENSYSVSLLDPFVDKIRTEGKELSDDHIIPYGAADTDYKTLLQPLVSSNVEAIYVPNYTQQLVAIVTAGDELGYEGKWIAGLDAAPSFNDIYGGDASHVYFINNINIFDEETKTIADSVAGQVSAVNKYFLGYDVIHIAKAAIEEAGLDDAEALRSAIENTTDFKGITGSLTIDPTTHMPKGMSMFMYTYDNQTPVLLEEFAG